MIKDEDIEYIEAAIDRAKLSSAEPGPTIRPKVGAVLVLAGKELGKAHRGETGAGDHAEYGLLERKLGHDSVVGGTLYTTLEPCTARNAPKVCCAERIASRKLDRVVIGMLDPNQLICGRGIRRLRSSGIEVDFFPSNYMKQVEEQNREFTRFHERQAQKAEGHIRAMAAINPRFEDDSARLDNKSFRVETVANLETIFIIAGDTIVCELLDRYACGLLREKIDNEGHGDPFRRGLIVSAATWKQDRWITEKCPGISIGGEGANLISKEWLEVASKKNIKPFSIGTGQCVYLSEPRPRVVLTGQTAADTRSAVRQYIAASRGLQEFLANAWP